jgi:hypothetical protein
MNLSFSVFPTQRKAQAMPLGKAMLHDQKAVSQNVELLFMI